MPLLLRLKLALGEALVFAPMRDQIGLRRLRWANTGGEPLAPRVLHGFRAFGINLKQSYGMPEPASAVWSRRMPEFDLDFTLLLVSSGLMIGLMYALIALGFVLVYKATDAINFAQGEFVMLAAIIAAAALGAALPFWLAAVICAGRHDRLLLRPRARGAAQAARPARSSR